MPNLTDPIFNNPDKAREHLEAIRWPNGPVCPRCGENDKVRKLAGKSTRPGVYKCNHCRKPFSVTVGTLFERSHIPLHKWVLATHLLCSSKKGMSAHQLHRMLGITYKSAWFMAHRIREAMREGSLSPYGSGGGTVEVDETFIGRDKSKPKKGGYTHKHKVLSLVDRTTGKARSFVIDDVNVATIAPIVRTNVAREARLMTDEAKYYVKLGREFAGHDAVHHSIGEYVSNDNRDIHTNTIEGYFSIFKRGMKGVYQHCAKKHLHRYLAEFDFRYNERVALGVDDALRAEKALEGIGGRRLTYRRIDERA